jgi:hypothetical protein
MHAAARESMVEDKRRDAVFRRTWRQLGIFMSCAAAAAVLMMVLNDASVNSVREESKLEDAEVPQERDNPYLQIGQGFRFFGVKGFDDSSLHRRKRIDASEQDANAALQWGEAHRLENAMSPAKSPENRFGSVVIASKEKPKPRLHDPNAMWTSPFRKSEAESNFRAVAPHGFKGHYMDSPAGGGDNAGGGGAGGGGARVGEGEEGLGTGAGDGDERPVIAGSAGTRGLGRGRDGGAGSGDGFGNSMGGGNGRGGWLRGSDGAGGGLGGGVGNRMGGGDGTGGRLGGGDGTGGRLGGGDGTGVGFHVYDGKGASVAGAGTASADAQARGGGAGVGGSGAGEGGGDAGDKGRGDASGGDGGRGDASGGGMNGVVGGLIGSYVDAVSKGVSAAGSIGKMPRALSAVYVSPIKPYLSSLVSCLSSLTYRVRSPMP